MLPLEAARGGVTLRQPALWFLGMAVLWHLGAGASQSPAGPSFEVASVKANKSGDARTDGILVGGRFSMLNETLWRLIGEAYAAPQALPRSRIIGGPSWIETDRFDIEGVSQGPLTRDQARLMLRALLAERFKLAIHTETRQLPVFELVLARTDGRLGSDLRRSGVDCVALRTGGGPPPPPAPNQTQPCVMGFGFGRLTARGMTIAELATLGVSRAAGRPTIDRTGLVGAFDWTLIWTPDNLPPRAPGTPPDQPLVVNGLTIDPNGPPLSTALQEQLGLKLQSAVGPVDALVIDRAERPTEN
jgi:uncharacterized protein (TIGR03435 family)